jgi:hypothetical protein
LCNTVQIEDGVFMVHDEKLVTLHFMRRFSHWWAHRDRGSGNRL